MKLSEMKKQARITCKDCKYFLTCGDHEGLTNEFGWCPSWVLCSYWVDSGTVENDWRETCVYCEVKDETK